MHRLILFVALSLAAPLAATETPSPTSTPSPTPACGHWDFGRDVAVAPGQQNPGPGPCGAVGSWAYMAGPTPHTPSSYYLATRFVDEGDKQSWRGDEFSGSYFPDYCFNVGASPFMLGPGLLQPGHAFVHPATAEAVVLRWRAPVSGEFRVHGLAYDADTSGGDGVLWSLDRGAVTVASGACSSDGSPEAFDETLTLSAGEDLYFIIEPGSGGYTGDSTGLDLAVDLLDLHSPTATHSPTASVSPTASPSSTVSPSPTVTETVTATPTASATASPTPSVSPTSTATATATPPATPAYARQTLGVPVLAGPVPQRSGGPLCLYFEAAPQGARLEAYTLVGEKVAALDAGSEGHPCVSTQGWAPGIYWLRLTQDGKSRWQKAAIVP